MILSKAADKQIRLRSLIMLNFITLKSYDHAIILSRYKYKYKSLKSYKVDSKIIFLRSKLYLYKFRVL